MMVWSDIHNLPKIYVCVFLTGELFAEMETPCWCLSERYRYGGHKVTETAVVEFCYQIDRLSLEGSYTIKVIVI